MKKEICGNCCYWDEEGHFCYLKPLYTFTEREHECAGRGMGGQLDFTERREE